MTTPDLEAIEAEIRQTAPKVLRFLDRYRDWDRDSIDLYNDAARMKTHLQTLITALHAANAERDQQAARVGALTAALVAAQEELNNHPRLCGCYLTAAVKVSAALAAPRAEVE